MTVWWMMLSEWVESMMMGALPVQMSAVGFSPRSQNIWDTALIQNICHPWVSLESESLPSSQTTQVSEAPDMQRRRAIT